MPAGYNHVEAFCLMRYQDEITGEVEVLWNSRDGVTPFIIASKAGNPAQHVDWNRDVRRPYHVPQVGDRIFVDLTEDNALDDYRAYVEKYWNDPKIPMSVRAGDMGLDKEGFARWLAKNDMEQNPGAPHVVEVTQAMHEAYLADFSKTIPRGGRHG